MKTTQEFFRKIEKDGLDTVIRDLKGIKDDDVTPENLGHVTERARREIRKLRRASYFLCPPHLLDVTQPEDHGYGTKEWEERWEAMQNRRYKEAVDHKLSCGFNLAKPVLGIRVLRSYGDTTGMLSEIAKDRIHRRCIYVRANGMRCCRYGEQVLCAHHRKELQLMDHPLVSSIKSEHLRDAIKRHMESPERRTLNTELAIQRTMLEALMQRFEEGRELSSINPAEVALIMQACKYITDTVEKCASIEVKMRKSLSFDQIQSLLENMVKAVVGVCNPSAEQMAMLGTELESLCMNRVTTDDPKLVTYGIDTPVGVKNSTHRDAYTEVEVVKDQWTDAEIREQKSAWDRKGPWTEKQAEKERIFAELADKLGIPK